MAGFAIWRPSLQSPSLQSPRVPGLRRRAPHYHFTLKLTLAEGRGGIQNPSTAKTPAKGGICRIRIRGCATEQRRQMLPLHQCCAN